jgi:GxxExxY protein
VFTISACRLNYEIGAFKHTERSPFPLSTRGKRFPGEGFRADLLVEDKVVLELKSVEVVQAIHKKQLLTYLRLANKPLGLLINFNETLLKNGITRIINTPASQRVG